MHGEHHYNHIAIRSLFLCFSNKNSIRFSIHSLSLLRRIHFLLFHSHSRTSLVGIHCVWTVHTYGIERRRQIATHSQWESQYSLLYTCDYTISHDSSISSSPQLPHQLAAFSVRGRCVYTHTTCTHSNIVCSLDSLLFSYQSLVVQSLVLVIASYWQTHIHRLFLNFVYASVY